MRLYQKITINNRKKNKLQQYNIWNKKCSESTNSVKAAAVLAKHGRLAAPSGEWQYVVSSHISLR